MSRHIAEVIRLYGGNEYREGREKAMYDRMIRRSELLCIFVAI